MKALTKIETKDSVATLEMISDNNIDRFIASRHCSVNTARAYKNSLRQFVNFLGVNHIADPVEDDINLWIEQLRAENKSTSTLRLYLTTIKMFFAFTAKRGIHTDIANEVKLHLPKPARHLKKSLSDDQARSLLNAVKGSSIKSKRDRAIIALSLCCGDHQFELIRANLLSLDVIDGVTILWVQGKGHKNSEDNGVKIPNQVASILQSYLDTRGKLSDCDPLFVSTSRFNHGARLGSQSIGKMIAKILRRDLQITDQKVSAHSTRHYTATAAIKRGISLREVSATLRHSNINITMTYINDLSIETRQCENVVADTLFSAIA